MESKSCLVQKKTWIYIQWLILSHSNNQAHRNPASSPSFSSGNIELECSALSLQTLELWNIFGHLLASDWSFFGLKHSAPLTRWCTHKGRHRTLLTLNRRRVGHDVLVSCILLKRMLRSINQINHLVDSALIKALQHLLVYLLVFTKAQGWLIIIRGVSVQPLFVGGVVADFYEWIVSFFKKGGKTSLVPTCLSQS